jgi:hypothetical protein
VATLSNISTDNFVLFFLVLSVVAMANYKGPLWFSDSSDDSSNADGQTNDKDRYLGGKDHPHGSYEDHFEEEEKE